MTSAAAIPNVSLNDENTIPVIGIGVGELTEAQAEHAVSSALEIGVRLIDTAAAYGNERRWAGPSPRRGFRAPRSS